MKIIKKGRFRVFRFFLFFHKAKGFLLGKRSFFQYHGGPPMVLKNGTFGQSENDQKSMKINVYKHHYRCNQKSMKINEKSIKKSMKSDDQNDQI